MKTKLQQIKDVLMAHSDFLVLCSIEERLMVNGNTILNTRNDAYFDHLRNRELSGFEHVVVINVAPVNGLYEIHEIQNVSILMISHLPTPDCIVPVNDMDTYDKAGGSYGDTNHLFLGSLRFDEEMGIMQTKVSHSFNSVEDYIKVGSGVSEKTQSLKRRIEILVYPDAELWKLKMTTSNAMFGPDVIFGEEYLYKRNRAKKEK